MDTIKKLKKLQASLAKQKTTQLVTMLRKNVANQIKIELKRINEVRISSNATLLLN